MRKVELLTGQGEYVATVEILPFPDKGMPRVVLWGNRTFVCDRFFPELGEKPWPYRESPASVSLTVSPGLPRFPLAPDDRFPWEAEDGDGPFSPPDSCRACGGALLPENRRIADGCACNSGRGVNHGLVPKNTCTCVERDPAQTGGTRIGPPPPPPPVDRSQRAVSGRSEQVGEADTTPKENGQQREYLVLTDAERAKGFVRPVRRGYVHTKCGTLTTMSRDIAETYARDPGFYSGTFCVGCCGHFPVGANGEFTWDGTTEKVGT